MSACGSIRGFKTPRGATARTSFRPHHKCLLDILECRLLMAQGCKVAVRKSRRTYPTTGPKVFPECRLLMAQGASGTFQHNLGGRKADRPEHCRGRALEDVGVYEEVAPSSAATSDRVGWTLQHPAVCVCLDQSAAGTLIYLPMAGVSGTRRERLVPLRLYPYGQGTDV